MKSKRIDALLFLLRLALGSMFLGLVGCAAIPKDIDKHPASSDPSLGGLLQTLHALETGLYDQHLQLQTAQLRYWHSEATKKQVAADKLNVAKTKLSHELTALTQATNSEGKRVENSKKSIQALNQQHIKLQADIKTLVLANDQLGQKTQKHLAQRQTEQQRLAALVTERHRLRQALTSMITSDNSLAPID